MHYYKLVNYTGYYSPQVKRKRVQGKPERAPENSFNEDLNIIQSMIKDLNRKIDLVTKKVILRKNWIMSINDLVVWFVVLAR